MLSTQVMESVRRAQDRRAIEAPLGSFLANGSPMTQQPSGAKRTDARQSKRRRRRELQPSEVIQLCRQADSLTNQLLLGNLSEPETRRGPATCQPISETQQPQTQTFSDEPPSGELPEPHPGQDTQPSQADTKTDAFELYFAQHLLALVQIPAGQNSRKKLNRVVRFYRRELGKAREHMLSLLKRSFGASVLVAPGTSRDVERQLRQALVDHLMKHRLPAIPPSSTPELDLSFWKEHCGHTGDWAAVYQPFLDAAARRLASDVAAAFHELQELGLFRRVKRVDAETLEVYYSELHVAVDARRYATGTQRHHSASAVSMRANTTFTEFESIHRCQVTRHDHRHVLVDATSRPAEANLSTMPFRYARVVLQTPPWLRAQLFFVDGELTHVQQQQERAIELDQNYSSTEWDRKTTLELVPPVRLKAFIARTFRKLKNICIASPLLLVDSLRTLRDHTDVSFLLERLPRLRDLKDPVVTFGQDGYVLFGWLPSQEQTLYRHRLRTRLVHLVASAVWRLMSFCGPARRVFRRFAIGFCIGLVLWVAFSAFVVMT